MGRSKKLNKSFFVYFQVRLYIEWEFNILSFIYITHASDKKNIQSGQVLT